MNVSAIFSGASRSVGTLATNIGHAASSLARGIGTFLGYCADGFTSGVNIVSPYTMELNPADTSTYHTNPLLKFFVIPIMQLLGGITAATILPIFYNGFQDGMYGIKNIHKIAHYYLTPAPTRVEGSFVKLNFHLARLYGLPGLIIGGAVGSVAALFYPIGANIVFFTAATTENWFNKGIYWSTYDQNDHSKNQWLKSFSYDRQSYFATFLSYVPFGFIPVVAGVGAFTINATIRVVWHSILSFVSQVINIFIWSCGDKDYYILGSPDGLNDYFKDYRIGSKIAALGIGLPGWVAGSALGVGIAAIIIPIRLVIHNIKSIMIGFVDAWNSSKAKGDKNRIGQISYNNADTIQFIKDIQIPPDYVHPAKVIAGAPGWFIGAISGGAANVVVNSVYNIYKHFINMRDWSLGNPEKGLILGHFDNEYNFARTTNSHVYYSKINRDDTRTNLDKHLFGLPGHLIGATIGLVVGSVIISVRGFVHNLKSFCIGFQDVANTYDNQPTFDNFEFTETKGILLDTIYELPQWTKHLMGATGYTIGGAVGTCIYVLPQITYNWLLDTSKSYLQLSRAYVNVATEQHYFSAQEINERRRPIDIQRSRVAQISGAIVGYPLATITAGLLPVIRKLGEFALIVTFVPISILVVGANKLFFYKKRFPGGNNEENSNYKIGKIKQLYERLVDGELLPKKAPIPGATSEEDFSTDILRKLTNFDADSKAEEILKIKLEKIRNNQNVTKLSEEELKQIKSRHHYNFLFTQDMRDKCNAETDIIVDETENYIELHLSNLDCELATATTEDRSYSALFFGKKDLLDEEEIPLFDHNGNVI